MLRPIRKDVNKKTVSLNNLPEDAHILYTYNDISKYINNAVSYIFDGLALNQSVIFVDSPKNIQMIRDQLISMGLEDKLQYVFFDTNDDFFETTTTFDPASVHANFFETTIPLLNNGINLRTWANVTWKDDDNILQKLTHHEAECDHNIKHHKSLTVCAYNGNIIPASYYIELGKHHDYLMVDSKISPSNFYSSDTLTNNSQSQQLKEINQQLMNSLNKTKEEYDFISDNSYNLITKVSKDGYLTFVSKTSKLLLGYEPTELIGKRVKECVHPEDFLTLKGMDPWGQEHLPHLTYRVKKKDGGYLWMKTAINVVRNSETSEPEEIIFSAIDITQEKFLKECLQKSEDQLEINKKVLIDLLDQLPEAIFIGYEGKMLYINPIAANLLEAEAIDLIGKKSIDFVHNDYIDKVNQRIKKVQKSGYTLDLMVQKVVTAKGNVVDVEAKTIPFLYDGRPAYLTVVRNITERLLNQELALKSEKLTVAGQLAAGIAHEIRNPLTSIKGFLQLLKAGTIDISNYYSIMESEISRIETISSELLVLGKPINTSYRKEDILTLVSDVKMLLETQAIMKGIDIILAIPPDEKAPCHCNSTQMKQVFINIIKNALEAMENNGTVIIKAQVEQDNVIIEIKDEGPGIPDDIIDRIGEPFFTTKDTGTGLGLMICYNIIEQHNGSLLVESEENVGTTFIITLPIKEK